MCLVAKLTEIEEESFEPDLNMQRGGRCMRIQCYDFVHELKSAGFTLVGKIRMKYSPGHAFGKPVAYRGSGDRSVGMADEVLEERDIIAYGSSFQKGGFITREWYLRCTCSREPRAFRRGAGVCSASSVQMKMFLTICGKLQVR